MRLAGEEGVYNLALGRRYAGRVKTRLRQILGRAFSLKIGGADNRGLGTPTDGKDFFEFVSKHLDKDVYLKLYPDVAEAKVDPLQHWLNHGMMKGRQISPWVQVHYGEAAKGVSSANWKRFSWRGQALVVKVEKPQSAETMAQILNQGRHDPAVMAPGAKAIKSLRQFDAFDMATRDGIDIDAFLAAIPNRPDVLLIMPIMDVGGAEKFAASLIAPLRASGHQSVLVIVTDQVSLHAPNWEKLAILKPFRSVQVVFWRDFCRSPNDYALARLVNGLRPNIAIVINSRIGLDMVARFGRGLSQYTRLYCAYFSLGVQALSAPYGTRFPRQTLRFAKALTDNEPTAATLRERYGNLLGENVVVLPPQIVPAAKETFNNRLIARHQHVASAARALRWAWVSRIEPYKGTQILSKLARRRPFDWFDLFGPPVGSLEAMGLAQRNVIHHGVLEDVSSADFSGYDGFLFTSLFEGMPNVVLEMAQHAIPLVLAKVGGLPDTFSEKAAFFVDTSDEDAAVDAFCHALDRVRDLTAEQTTSMVIAARDQTLERHSLEAFARNVITVFGQR